MSARSRAVRAADDGAWEVSAEAYREALTDSPHDPELWVGLGRVHLRLNEPAHAREAFERAAAAGDDSARLRIQFGRTHELEHHYDEALNAYRLATQLEPGNAYAWRFGGARLLRWGDHSASIPWLKRAVALDPDNVDTWNALGIAHAQDGDLPGAEATFRAGVERHPDHRGLRLGLAAVLVNAHRHEDALALYNDVVRRWPDFGAAHVGRALVLDALGRSDEAEAALEQASAVEPSNREYSRRFHLYRTQRASGIR